MTCWPWAPISTWIYLCTYSLARWKSYSIHHYSITKSFAIWSSTIHWIKTESMITILQCWNICCAMYQMCNMKRLFHFVIYSYIILHCIWVSYRHGGIMCSYQVCPYQMWGNIIATSPIEKVIHLSFQELAIDICINIALKHKFDLMLLFVDCSWLNICTWGDGSRIFTICSQERGQSIARYHLWQMSIFKN